MRRRHTAWIVAAGLLAGCTEVSPQAQPGDPARIWPVFCYRTLADVGCYAETDPGRERRMVGIYALVGDPWWIAYGPDQPAPDGPLPLFPPDR